MGSVATFPVRALFRTVQGLATGRAAILDVEVKRLDDAMLRQAWLRRLRRAAAEPGVRGFVLRIEAPPGSWAACGDLRNAITQIRQAGKPVYAWLDRPGNATMWIASACERIFLVPTGEVDLVGVGTEQTFFGALLDRLGVDADLEAAGAYKSFGEPFTRSFASPANQEAIRAPTVINSRHRRACDMGGASLLASRVSQAGRVTRARHLATGEPVTRRYGRGSRATVPDRSALSGERVHSCLAGSGTRSIGRRGNGSPSAARRVSRFARCGYQLVDACNFAAS